VPTYATAVNTWQCDENDHLNVQFYTEFAQEASAHLLVALGLGRHARAAQSLSVRATEDHIRYLREFRVLDPVEVRSAPVEIGARYLLLHHEVRHRGTGVLAATLRRRIESDTPWPEAFSKSVNAACVVPAPPSRPPSAGTMVLPDIRLADAAGYGLVEVGRSLVKPVECDETGAMMPRHQTGRYSDGAPMLWNHMGFDRAAMQDRHEGSVVLEMLQQYRRPLQAGDATVLMSGLAGFSDKIVKLVHFLFDAETGTLAASAEAIGVKFDQQARKIMTFTDEDRARLGRLTLSLPA